MTTTRDIAGWIGVLKVKVQAMQAEMVRLEKLAANHRINFERERDRAGQLVDELLQMTATAIHARRGGKKAPRRRDRCTAVTEFVAAAGRIRAG